MKACPAKCLKAGETRSRDAYRDCKRAINLIRHSTPVLRSLPHVTLTRHAGRMGDLALKAQVLRQRGRPLLCNPAFACPNVYNWAQNSEREKGDALCHRGSLP